MRFCTLICQWELSGRQNDDAEERRDITGTVLEQSEVDENLATRRRAIMKRTVKGREGSL